MKVSSNPKKPSSATESVSALPNVSHTSHTSPLLRICDVTKQFRSGNRDVVNAVKRVNISLHRGEVVAILGENGAGKTTLIDMILGLTTPTSGHIEVLGHSPRDAIRVSKIGAVLQTGGLLPDVAVADTLRMIASGYPEHIAIDQLVEQVGLQDLLDRKVGKCSGGEQQRVKFALALLGNPELIVLDEPTTGMDPSARREFWAGIHACAQRGTTILFTTHYMDEAEKFARRIVMMHKGNVLADLDTQSMLALAQSALVQASFPAEVDRQGATPLPPTAAVPDNIIDEVTEISGLKQKNKSLFEPSAQEDNRAVRTLQFRTREPDALIRYLVTETNACNFTVQKASLDDVFISMQRDAEQSMQRDAEQS
ncbi:ABC transporter ATP-binding protein [Corynebacterium lactis]|uniref:ABC transporter ATP-binding protein n=1 Tax=Corynebacterium lactis RW2-5 TaxID=1408189 RepID=A0A0K2H0S5_9CORY|nr:ABC transporter ATP-binding protein [Corynebacterium lactis]ALA67543.1 ABC transporter ATP-binding protein [Corynebacterium lactis RW2-5]